MAKIAVLTFTETARDPRVSRHLEALGTEFEVLSCGTGPEPPGVQRHLQIPDDARHIPSSIPGMLALLTRRSDSAYATVGAANAARRLLSTENFDLIMANDVDCVPIAIELAAGRPVVADMHEYAPRHLEQDWRWRLMLQDYNTALCRKYLPRCAAVTTVSRGLAEEYERQFGVKAEMITNASPFRSPSLRPPHAPVRLVHTGAAVPGRRIEVMIEAAAGLHNVRLDLFLVASPRHSSYRRDLSRRAADTPNVRVLPPVGSDQLPTMLTGYDVGLSVLAPTSFNLMYSLPNKLFDYIQAGLGVVVGPSPEMSRVVRDSSLGAVTEDFSPAAVRRVLAHLTPEVAAEWMSQACKSADELSSAVDAERLRGIIRSRLPSDAF